MEWKVHRLVPPRWSLDCLGAGVARARTANHGFSFGCELSNHPSFSGRRLNFFCSGDLWVGLDSGSDVGSLDYVCIHLRGGFAFGRV